MNKYHILYFYIDVLQENFGQIQNKLEDLIFYLVLLLYLQIYEFDLVSVDQKSLDMDPDLNNPVYVVKFSYPKNKR